MFLKISQILQKSICIGVFIYFIYLYLKKPNTCFPVKFSCDCTTVGKSKSYNRTSIIIFESLSKQLSRKLGSRVKNPLSDAKFLVHSELCIHSLFRFLEDTRWKEIFLFFHNGSYIQMLKSCNICYFNI